MSAPFTEVNKVGAKPLLWPHICPARFAWFLDNPLRRRIHNPERFLAGVITPSAVVLDLGCGSGTFTSALARMVGPTGRVIAADVQPAMLAKVQKLVDREGIQDRVRLHLCGANHISLAETVDFVLAFWMVHEVPDVSSLLSEVYAALKPGGKLLMVEPRGHVGSRLFESEIKSALATGFKTTPAPKIAFSRSALLVK